jgi:uncharacterized protein (DUF1330 family)
MPAYVIFGAEVCDLARGQDFIHGLKPALRAAGERSLARGGVQKDGEGQCPRRIGQRSPARTEGLAA